MAGDLNVQPMTDLSRLSLNQMTTNQWNLREAVEGCARAGIPYIGLWRQKADELGIKESAKIVRESGIKVSSLCRGGLFPAATESERQARIDDNKRAIDEAAELGTDLLVLVCGAAADKDIDAARGQVEAGIEAIAPYAAERGVQLGIEPLHPMFAADRSVVVTLGQANRIAERLDIPHVGVVIDVYHVWWDPDAYKEIEKSRGRILAFHVNDWIVPLADMLNGRGMMGDGSIQLRRFRGAVDAAGYTGPIEVEIFNEELWSRPGDEVVQQVTERYLQYV